MISYFPANLDAVNPFIYQKTNSEIIKIGARDTNVVIDWKYQLQDPNSLDKLTFGYILTDNSQAILAVKKKGEVIQPNRALISPNIVIEADDVSLARITLKDIILLHENTKTYFCTILYKSETLSFTSEVKILVYGKSLSWHQL